MVSKRPANIWVYVTATLLMASLVLLGQDRISKYINGDNVEKIKLNALFEAFNNIPLRDGDQLGTIKSFDKESIVGVTSHAISAASPEAVTGFYIGTLKSAGWKLHNAIHRTDGSEKVRLCKDRMSLTIDASPKSSGSRYYIGLVWTRYRMSADYCPEASVTVSG